MRRIRQIDASANWLLHDTICVGCAHGSVWCELSKWTHRSIKKLQKSILWNGKFQELSHSSKETLTNFVPNSSRFNCNWSDQLRRKSKNCAFLCKEKAFRLRFFLFPCVFWQFCLTNYSVVAVRGWLQLPQYRTNFNCHTMGPYSWLKNRVRIANGKEANSIYRSGRLRESLKESIKGSCSQ